MYPWVLVSLCHNTRTLKVSLVCPSWAHLQILKVQVSLVLVGGLVSTMAVADDWVEEVLEHLIGFLITSYTANSHDEGVTWKKSCTNQNNA